MDEAAALQHRRVVVLVDVILHVVAQELFLEEVRHLVVVVLLDERHHLAVGVDFLKQKGKVVLRIHRQVVELEAARPLFEKQVVGGHGGGAGERRHERVLVRL